MIEATKLNLIQHTNGTNCKMYNSLMNYQIVDLHDNF